MKDETEHILESLAPRSAPARLRTQVLNAVSQELTADRTTRTVRPRWDVSIGFAVATSLILGVALNVWAIRSDDAAQAKLFGPDMLPRDIQETLETTERIAGPEFASLLRQRLRSAWKNRRRSNSLDDFRRQQSLLLSLTEGRIDDKTNLEVERHQPRRPNRSASCYQRYHRVA